MASHSTRLAHCSRSARLAPVDLAHGKPAMENALSERRESKGYSGIITNKELVRIGLRHVGG